MIRYLSIVPIFFLTASALGQGVLQGEYSILDRMSIFSRTRTIRPTNGGESLIRQPSAGPTREKAPVFIGAIKVDTGIVGVVQVFASNGSSEIIDVKPGDTIHWGNNNTRVVEVSFDTLHLAAGTEARTVIPMGSDLRTQGTATGSPPNGRNNLPGRGAAFTQVPNGRGGRGGTLRNTGGNGARGSGAASVNVSEPASESLTPEALEQTEALMKERRAAETGAGN